jgi:hypothetical protein
MSGLLRGLLAVYALMSILGSVWYFGDPGTYAALIFAVAALAWTLGWHRPKFWLLSATSAMCALVAVCWMFAVTFDATEMDANLLRGAGVLIVVGCLIAWVKQRRL